MTRVHPSPPLPTPETVAWPRPVRGISSRAPLGPRVRRARTRRRQRLPSTTHIQVVFSRQPSHSSLFLPKFMSDALALRVISSIYQDTPLPPISPCLHVGQARVTLGMRQRTKPLGQADPPMYDPWFAVMTRDVGYMYLRHLEKAVLPSCHPWLKS